MTGTVPVNKDLLAGTVPVNKELLTGRVPVNKELLTGRVPVNNLFLHKYKVFGEGLKKIGAKKKPRNPSKW